MADITLYTFGTPNGFKASITLEELGLPYKAVEIDIFKKEQKEDWYLKINPNGAIPAILDGNQRVSESGAIMLYLTQKYDAEGKISYAPGTPEYTEQLSWLMLQVGGLGPMQTQAHHFRVFADARSEYAIERYYNETKRLYSVLDSRLKESPYLAGDKYTIADIAHFVWTTVAPIILEIDISEWPALKEWVDRIKQREGMKKGLGVPKSAFGAEKIAEHVKKGRARIDAMTNTDR
ncbi:Glutathione S-transferase, C-terminal-like protein [Elaphomyces granulatus]